jgi:hypothetical protein
MQHDAELAVVGVSGCGVNVGHLHQGQQGQQNQAQNRRGRGKSAEPWCSAACLEPVQNAVTPTFKDTQNWMRGGKERFRSPLEDPVDYLFDIRPSKM